MSQSVRNYIAKLAVFDLDGTLLDTIGDLGRACNHALSAFGYPSHAEDEYPRLVGNGVNRLIERALPEGEKSEANVLRLREVFVPYYNLHNKILTHPYDGIRETLQQLKHNGWLLAVASNKYQAATEDLIGHFFPDTFNVVLGERDGCPRKPDPRIVHDIVESVKRQKQEDEKVSIDEDSLAILYIGDSDVDMQTAKKAGIRSVACTWGFCTRETLMQYMPDYVIDCPQQLLQIANLIN